jgi:hypothetical protein
MKRVTLQVDLKSLLIGILLAACAFLWFSGTPSQAQTAIQEISAGDGGVYIINGHVVYWKSKDQCSNSIGCHP